jgi:hypothetical protein
MYTYRAQLNRSSTCTHWYEDYQLNRSTCTTGTRTIESIYLYIESIYLDSLVRGLSCHVINEYKTAAHEPVRALSI